MAKADTFRSINEAVKGEPFKSDGRQFNVPSIHAAAKAHGVLANNICCMCLSKITIQIFKNSGVCCEQHRKDRDNDHAPAGGIA